MAEHSYIISIGSNIHPEENIERVKQILQEEQKLRGLSAIIRTEPVGYQNQPDFLNGACLVVSELDYDDFNRYLKNVENRLGRVRGPIKSGPRTMDLDIIIHNGIVVHDDFYAHDHTRKPVQELLERFEISPRDDRSALEQEHE